MSYTELSSKYVKSKKEHSCEWCAEKILIGEKCFYRAYISDRDFMHGRMHIECEEAMLTVDHRELEDGWSPGDYKRGSSECR